MYVFVYIYIYAYICTCMYAHIYTYMYIGLRKCLGFNETKSGFVPQRKKSNTKEIKKEGKIKAQNFSVNPLRMQMGLPCGLTTNSLLTNTPLHTIYFSRFTGFKLQFLTKQTKKQTNPNPIASCFVLFDPRVRKMSRLLYLCRARVKPLDGRRAVSLILFLCVRLKHVLLAGSLAPVTNL